MSEIQPITEKLQYAKKAGENFQAFSNGPEMQSIFTFIEDPKSIKNADDYFPLLMETATAALKTYDTNKDGIVTVGEMSKNQTDILNKELAKMAPEGMPKEVVDAVIAKIKKTINFDPDKFAQNWANFDGDGSSISKEDMAIYLAAADNQDGNYEGIITKENEDMIAQGVEGAPEKLQSFVDIVMGYFKPNE